jgi:hypothetical protein
VPVKGQRAGIEDNEKMGSKFGESEGEPPLEMHI